MKPKIIKIKPYEAKDGWRWRGRAGNGRIVCESGEAYSSKRACQRAAFLLTEVTLLVVVAR